MITKCAILPANGKNPIAIIYIIFPDNGKNPIAIIYIIFPANGLKSIANTCVIPMGFSHYVQEPEVRPILYTNALALAI